MTNDAPFRARPFRCGNDSAAMDALGNGAHECPTCGLRTDTRGNGTLDDGFDVTPYQWGLRGDVHAWAAMRDLVAGTPTPADPHATQHAYTAALHRTLGPLADVTEPRVYVAALDHGGMSGGHVDLVWWLDTGIPHLVGRAMARRPG